MKTSFRIAALSFILFLLIAFAALPAAAGSPNLEYGPALSMGNGIVRSFVALNGGGVPKEIGIEFSMASLTGLPGEELPPSDGTWDNLDAGGDVVWYCCGYEHVLALPAAAAATPFKHIVVNWNNHGHPPPGIYSVPHFDFHFYTISNAVRQTITAPTAGTMCAPLVPLTCDVMARALAPLSPGEIPPRLLLPRGARTGHGESHARHDRL